MDPNAQLSCNTSQSRRPLDESSRVKKGKTYADTVRVRTSKMQPTASSTAQKTALRRKRGKRGNGPQRKAKRAARDERRRSETGATRNEQWQEVKGAARSRDVKNPENLGGLLEQHTRLLGQLVASMARIQRAVAAAPPPTSDRGQEGKPQQHKDHVKYMAGSKSKQGTSNNGVLQQSDTVRPPKQRSQLNQSKARLLVRVMNKARGQLQSEMPQAQVAAVMQDWAHNAPKIQEQRLAKMSAQQCIIAVAEHIGSKVIMLSHSSLTADMAEQGITNAKQILDSSSELCEMRRKFTRCRQISVAACRKIKDAITDDKFREELCCLNYYHQHHWKYFDPSRTSFS